MGRHASCCPLHEAIAASEVSNICCCREIATYNPEDGLPDGLTLDSEGRIWTAFAKGGAIICLDPQTGKELGRWAST